MNSVGERISAAYAQIAREPGDFISISDLADRLAGRVPVDNSLTP